MADVFRTPPAAQDVDDIFDYLAMHDVGAAVRFLAEFDRKADLYAGNPQLGEAWPDFGREVRAFRVGRYLVVYRPTDRGIELLRVLHTARDIPRFFGGGI